MLLWLVTVISIQLLVILSQLLNTCMHPSSFHSKVVGSKFSDTYPDNVFRPLYTPSRASRACITEYEPIEINWIVAVFDSEYRLYWCYLLFTPYSVLHREWECWWTRYPIFRTYQMQRPPVQPLIHCTLSHFSYRASNITTPTCQNVYGVFRGNQHWARGTNPAPANQHPRGGSK